MRYTGGTIYAAKCEAMKFLERLDEVERRIVQLEVAMAIALYDMRHGCHGSAQRSLAEALEENLLHDYMEYPGENRWVCVYCSEEADRPSQVEHAPWCPTREKIKAERKGR